MPDRTTSKEGDPGAGSGASLPDAAPSQGDGRPAEPIVWPPTKAELEAALSAAVEGMAEPGAQSAKTTRSAGHKRRARRAGAGSGKHRSTRARRRDRASAAEGRRRRRRWVVVALVVALVVAVIGVLAGVATVRLSAPPPAVTVHTTMPTSRTVPGDQPNLPWPATGQSALSIPSLGYSSATPFQGSVPVASLTKLMTAYVILRDHPLTPGQAGPLITITADDATYYQNAVATDQSSALVAAGERLTERQMLDGMLVHSANNLAYALATWDAGSQAAFVDKMNSAAVSLGMHESHFADASGDSPQSMSTAADILKVAALDMANPTFAQIVSQTVVTLPFTGPLDSYTPLLPGGPDGTPGVVGVKSGFTNAAGGGDVLGYEASTAGHHYLILAAVIGQETPNVLEEAGELALGLAQAAQASVVNVPVVAAGTSVGEASVPSRSVHVVTSAGGSLLAWPGQRIVQSMVDAKAPKAGAPAGTVIGRAVFTLGQEQVAVAARTTARLPTPSWSQRLF